MIGTTSRGTGAIGQCCIRFIKLFLIILTSYMIHTASISSAPNHPLVAHSTLPMHLSFLQLLSSFFCAPSSSAIYPPTCLLLFQTFHYQETAVDEAIPPTMSGSRWVTPPFALDISANYLAKQFYGNFSVVVPLLLVDLAKKMAALLTPAGFY